MNQKLAHLDKRLHPFILLLFSSLEGGEGEKEKVFL